MRLPSSPVCTGVCQCQYLKVRGGSMGAGRSLVWSPCTLSLRFYPCPHHGWLSHCVPDVPTLYAVVLRLSCCVGVDSAPMLAPTLLTSRPRVGTVRATTVTQTPPAPWMSWPLSCTRCVAFAGLTSIFRVLGLCASACVWGGLSRVERQREISIDRESRGGGWGREGERERLDPSSDQVESS